MESDEDDEETQASFCGFLDDNFKLPISAYAPGFVPKVEIKERLSNNEKTNSKVFFIVDKIKLIQYVKNKNITV